MPPAVIYQQSLYPFGETPAGKVVSTVFAALPVLVLLYLLAWRRWLPPKAGAVAAAVAAVTAWLAYGMPADLVGKSFLFGAAWGLLPIGWTILNAMLLYNLTVASGQFAVVRRSVGSVSGDARVQAVLIGFAFGAFLEGAAGSGSPVAICGVILAGLGFDPFRAAVICLIANTSPVAYGGLGTPVLTLASVTDLPAEDISVMAAHQLPILSVVVPVYMVKCMCSWRETVAVWPVLAVAGGSFAAVQYFCGTSHLHIGVTLFPITDVAGGVVSLVVTALFLRVWRPRQEWHFPPPAPPKPGSKELPPDDPHKLEVEAMLAGAKDAPAGDVPLTPWNVAKAWMPFAVMSLFLVLIGFVRQAENKRGALPLGPVKSYYEIPVTGLNEEVERPDRLKNPKEPTEKAVFKFVWLTAPGTPVMFACVFTVLFLRMTPTQIGEALRTTAAQMSITLPTIAFMLGLSYVTRYAGMDATLGVAFAGTGWLYPFFAAVLGWLGVFLTGTDAGSNALFGSLQKITATEVYNGGAFAATGLRLEQAQTLICTANSTGGVMGKMIDAQSIVVATSATHQIGREADIFWAVLWHSIVLASVIGLMTLVQAYIAPFTGMVPG